MGSGFFCVWSGKNEENRPLRAIHFIFSYQIYSNPIPPSCGATGCTPPPRPRHPLLAQFDTAKRPLRLYGLWPGADGSRHAACKACATGPALAGAGALFFSPPTDPVLVQHA